MQVIDGQQVSTAELIKLCAVSNKLYEKIFFAHTVRQESPYFHSLMDDAFASRHRYIAIKCYRGAAKTSKFRMFVSKNIAYGIAHTILLVSNSQGHAVKSLEWIKRAVEFNKQWTQTFGLRRGARWSGEDIEIIHGIDEYPIRVLALGITGQIRGFNIDDYRPDFIGVDDPDDEETTSSIEQIKKTADRFFGGLVKSLAPESEAPHAKLITMQTPFVHGDLIDVCSNDPQFHNLTFGCFDANGRSTWEERFPTEMLQKDKAAHVRRGHLALWMREMECEVIPEGGAAFNPENLKFWDVLPESMVYVIAIDPASSAAKTADDQVIAVIGFYRSDVYLVEYSACKGEMPEEAGVKVIEFIRHYKPLGITVEIISYQRVLATFLEQRMRETRVFAPIFRQKDKRKKADRILQAIGSTAGFGRLYVRDSMSKFLSQYGTYSPTAKMHDDVLDALAMGIDYGLQLGIPAWDQWIEGDYTVITEEGTRRPVEFRICP